VLAPGRVDRLVLCCTTPGGADAFPLPEATLKLFAEAPTLAPELALRRFIENALAPDPPEALVEEIFARRVANPPDPGGWQAQAAAGTTFAGVAGEIRHPTLVLQGTEDNVVDPRNADLLRARIPGARVELIPGTGHLFFWEKPGEAVTLIREFLG
jgi:pimeloyl-ACP methyl ester carboxylesterase